MAKNPYISITRPNQWEYSKYARLLRQMNRLDGAELMEKGQIPIGYFFYPPPNGKGNGHILAPEKVYIGVCPKCHGTGLFLNHGVCFDCIGKGFLTGRDIARDEAFHSIRCARERETQPIEATANS